MRTPSNVRLFIALWPGDALREQVAAWQSQWEWPSHAAVVKAERLHVTLHFLGDAPPQRVLDLKYVLERITPQAFDLHFARYEMWQHGVAVMRPDNSPTALRGLHARIGLALAGIGMTTEERPYRPHVTLARRASGAKPPEPPNVLWQSTGEFVLVQTLGGGRGYQILERFGG